MPLVARYQCELLSDAESLFVKIHGPALERHRLASCRWRSVRVTRVMGKPVEQSAQKGCFPVPDSPTLQGFDALSPNASLIFHAEE